MSDATETSAVQAALDDELAKMVEAAGSPEAKASLLVKIGFYRQELNKQADMLANVDPELAEQVAEEWFAGGDELLKRAIWNSAAGAEEIVMRKEAPVPAAEQALAKMIEATTNDDQKAHLLHKIGNYTIEVHNLLEGLHGHPDERVEAVMKGWLTADPGNTQLKKNILDAEMGRVGRRLYGQGIKAGDVVDEYDGNASSHAGSKLGGSEDNPEDKAMTRSVPHPSKREGAGKRVSGSKPAPGQADAKTVNPGSGKTDDGDSITPTTVITRKGTTGGLGSVSGAEGGEGAKTVEQDDTFRTSQWGKGNQGPKQTVARPKGKDRKAEKAEFISDLIKAAPDDMVEALLELDNEEEQQAAAEIAGDHGLDLIAWCDQLPEDGLAKRDLDVHVEEWLAENPDQIQLKKWVAEALVTAEEIPLELGRMIMHWEPQSQVTVRKSEGGARFRQSANA